MEKTISRNFRKSFIACLEIQLDGLLSQTDQTTTVAVLKMFTNYSFSFFKNWIRSPNSPNHNLVVVQWLCSRLTKHKIDRLFVLWKDSQQRKKSLNFVQVSFKLPTPAVHLKCDSILSFKYCIYLKSMHERHISCPSYAPNQGHGLQPRHLPCPEQDRNQTFQVAGQHSIH